jgi:hypothetical protein
LRQGASRIWNCWRKPWCVVVTDSIYRNISTPAVRCCSDQSSLSTKLQTSLWMTTITVEAAHSKHSGF